MAYEKHTWVCGETITAELLNAIEGGVEAVQPMILTLGGTTQEEADDAIVNGAKLNATWQEIDDAFRTGRRIIAVANPYMEETLTNTMTITVLSVIGGNGIVSAKPTVLCSWSNSAKPVMPLTCDTANDYPKTNGSIIG